MAASVAILGEEVVARRAVGVRVVTTEPEYGYGEGVVFVAGVVYDHGVEVPVIHVRFAEGVAVLRGYGLLAVEPV